eukprot:UN15391
MFKQKSRNRCGMMFKSNMNVD